MIVSIIEHLITPLFLSLFLYVYSDHSILECYNLFSGVELSMRSFFVISVSGMGFSAGGSVVPEVT